MAFRLASWLTMSFLTMFEGRERKLGRRPRARTASGQDALRCEALEDRVVLSSWSGQILSGSFAKAGFIDAPRPPADSSETVGDGRAQDDSLTRLGPDGPALAWKDLWFEGQGLQNSMTHLVSAVADGSD